MHVEFYECTFVKCNENCDGYWYLVGRDESFVSFSLQIPHSD